MNAAKPIVFPGSILSDCISRINDMVGFTLGALLFMYLGVPLFLGRAELTGPMAP